MIPDEAFWLRLADAADAATMMCFRGGGAVENKLDRGFDPVTAGDREAERALRDLIGEAFPDDAILGEEYGSAAGGSGRRWIIDPIDGTRAFVAGMPTWMTLVGLEVGGRAVAGLASQPVTGERFVAREGRALRHHRGASSALAVRATSPSEAVAMTVDPFLFDGDGREALDAIRRECRLMRYSADAYAFCGVATGSVQVAFERGVAPYDVGALIPLVEAAGGVFSTWHGERPEAGGDVIAAASPELLDWALSHLGAVSSRH